MPRTLLLLFVGIALVTNAAMAQDSLPAPVQTLITTETVAVMRVDLKSLDLDQVGPVLRNWLDPTWHEGRRVHQLEQALQKLKPLHVDELYLLLSTSDFPSNGLLVVPTKQGPAVAESLNTVWPDDVEEVPGGVIAGDEAARKRGRSVKIAARPEFTTALESVQKSTLRLVVAPSADARRVLREFAPALPDELGGGSLAALVDGTQWLSLGVNLPPQPEVRLTIQTKDAKVAESLQRTLASAVRAAATSDAVKELLPKAEGLATLLVPRQNGDRVAIALVQADFGTQRFVDEVVAPLNASMEQRIRRTRTVSRLKQLLLGMHTYHDAFNRFPPAAKLSPDGKHKLLSWRVLLLPYIDGKALYDQFHLDEPWDSPHNKMLIEKMPSIYESANVTREMKRLGKTTYLVPVGPKTIFENPAGTAIGDIVDGTSNTILIVDAHQDLATFWTKPDDLPFDPKAPLKGISGQPGNRFWSAFADGSVRRLDDTVNLKNLVRYLQMNDREIIE